MITVEVAYATPKKQQIISLQVPEGTVALEAVKQSGIAEVFPQINIETDPMGIFGNTLGARGLAVAAKYILKEGDRIEIYRPLIADPKEARRQRAQRRPIKP